MYKIIFTDIDGTLRNSKKDITQRTKDDIKKLKDMGIEVVLCSGRPRCDVEKVARGCNSSRYIISSNGAELYNYIEKKVELKDMISCDAVEELYEISEKYNCTFVMNCGNIRIVNKLHYNNQTERIPSDGIIKAAFENDIIQCTIINNNLEKMKLAREEILNVKNAKIINESKVFTDKKVLQQKTIYFDLVDTTVSKKVAAEKLCEILNVKPEETIAIGDSYNDIELLEFAGYSVAMKNSIRGMKSKVDFVTDENDLDGAAKFFEKVLNNEIK